MLLVFISHSSGDHKTVTKIVDDLESNGINCWLSSRDIKPGASWATSIMVGIESSAVMLLILSDSSNKSQQVVREVEEAVGRNIPIVPVIMGKFNISKGLKYFINSHQWIDASNKKTSNWIPIVIEAINSHITPAKAIEADLPSNNSTKPQKNKYIKKLPLAFLLILAIFALFKINTITDSDYDKACELLDKGEYETASNLFFSFAENNPNSPNYKSALLSSAHTARLAGLETAGDYYLSFINLYPNDYISQLSLYWAARSYEECGESSKALEIHSQIAKNDTFPAELSLYSIGEYADYMYSLSAFSLAESLYIRNVNLSDTVKTNLLNRFPFAEKLSIPELHYNPAKYSYRIATIQASRINFSSITSENVAQFTQQKAELESWIGKCLKYSESDFFTPACGLAASMYYDFANGVAFMEPPSGLDSISIDEFYNQLYIQVYEPEVNKAVNILSVAVEYSLSDNIVTVAEKVFIKQFAEQIDFLIPGKTSTLGIPDSIYTPLVTQGPFSREMRTFEIRVANYSELSFLQDNSKQIAQPLWSIPNDTSQLDLGYRDMSQIRAKVRIIKEQIQTAYEDLLRSDPRASGTITVQFSITPSGSVTGISVSGELSSLHSTVRLAINALNFDPAPEQTGNLPVTVPFRLVPPQ